MAIGVMPALETAQESDKVISWLRQEVEIVAKGEPLLEIGADKAVIGNRIARRFSPVASGRKTSAAAPLAAVSAQVSTQPAAAADIRISRKARRLAAELRNFFETSQRRLAIRCGISTEPCVGGLFRQDAVSLVY
jgi:hypothetical protein